MEKILINAVVLLIYSVWQILAQTYILEFIFNLKFKFIQRIFYAFILSLCVTSFKLFAPEFLILFNPLFIIILMSTMLWILFKIPIKKCILYPIFIILISIPIEVIAGFIDGIFKISTVSQNANTNIIILFIVNIFYTILALTIYLYQKRKSFSFIFTNSKLSYINIFLIVSLIVPNVMFYALNKYNYPAYLLIYNIFANFTLVVLSIYNTYKNMELEIKKRDLENAEVTNKNLSNLVDSVRIFKHDYNNVVHAIAGYLSVDDLSGLKKYFSGVFKDSMKVNNLEAISPKKINEPSIYNIIASKYQIADLKGISFKLESLFDFQKLNMPVYEFCKILGILLDNALEAAECSEEKIINILIRESYNTKAQAISIENTYANKDVDINKIFEKDVSSKKVKSGLGLWEVKNIVDKNDNLSLITSKDEDFFKQELIIANNN